MSDQNNPGTQLSSEELEDLVASTDTGGRQPRNKNIALLIAGIAFIWSAFQVWYSSPIPFVVGWGVFNSNEARPIHLAFAFTLAFLAYPAFKSSPRRSIPITDWLLAIVGSFCASYVFIFNTELVGDLLGSRLSDRPGNPNQFDIAVTVIGIVVLLEATRRALGPPLAIIAGLFLAYSFLGQHAPSLIAWKGASFSFMADKQWLSSDGVFGTALSVSADIVFLFVLFGALLEKAGAGNYFIKVAFSLMGHMRGGPAKAAVVASGMTGLISGSSIANVVTTGTFTIPMMKRVGFSREKAGAVEVASSVNGQIMPPVMGAAAFLMVEYVGISYFEVVKHAFIPAVISYIALVYIVHLEAVKKGMEGLPRATEPKPAKWAMISFMTTISAVLALGGAVYWIMEVFKALDRMEFQLLAIAAVLLCQFLIHRVFLNSERESVKYRFFSMFGSVIGNAVIIGFGVGIIVNLVTAYFGSVFAPWVIGSLLVASYIWLASRCAKEPDLEVDDPNSPIVALPEPGPTIRAGLYYLLPVAVLIWLLMVERKSASLSAFWAVAFMIFILLTQKYLFAIFRGENRTGKLWDSTKDLIDGMITGARNMIGIGIATAAAGVVVGTVVLTGVGSALADVVEILSQGQIMLILIFTAILSLILGMGLPTTANYIVVSSLLAPVIVELGLENGLIVPLIAVHLFVFYFGIMADVTPPVGLASFAAAAVSGGDPIRTGFVAFFYSLRTALLPFLFIFNTDLLLIDVTPMEGVFVFIVATAAMLLFTAGTQGYFFARSKLWENIVLILIAFTLFRPGFWMDLTVPPYEEQAPSQVFQAAENLPEGAEMRLIVEGLDDVGDVRVFTAVINLGAAGSGQDRLFDFGLELLADGDEVIVDNATYDSPAQQAGFDFDQKILTVLVPASQPPKELFYIPALLLLGLIILLQRRRMQAQSLNAATA